MPTALEVLGALCGVAACVIAFLAWTDEYERDLVSDPREGRVLEVRNLQQVHPDP